MFPNSLPNEQCSSLSHATLSDLYQLLSKLNLKILKCLKRPQKGQDFFINTGTFTYNTAI